jgi:hypothetical protein
MAVQRIYNDPKRMHGWLARADALLRRRED